METEAMNEGNAKMAMAGKQRRINYLEKRNHELECAITEIQLMCDKMIRGIRTKRYAHRGKGVYESRP